MLTHMYLVLDAAAELFYLNVKSFPGSNAVYRMSKVSGVLLAVIS